MEDLPLLPVLLPRSQITAALPLSPSSSSSDEDGDEVDDAMVGGSDKGEDVVVGAGNGGMEGNCEGLQNTATLCSNLYTKRVLCQAWLDTLAGTIYA